MKTVFMQDHTKITGAGKWIYDGYKKAWESLGYEAVYLEGASGELSDYGTETLCKSKEHHVMASDFWLQVFKGLTQQSLLAKEDFDLLFNKAEKVFLHCQPNNFPKPWGGHTNFICQCDQQTIEEINHQDRFKLWSFVDVEKVKDEFYPLWKDINPIFLAYDNLSYEYLEDDKYKFDVCYIGGRANNGFDEKYKIMISHFTAFKDSGLKCGFFVGKNLTHEQENKILYNSKVSINIHDAYQRTLGLDTNERTFKSLGLTGALVSDKVDHLGELFPDVKMTNDPKQMVKFVKEYVNMPEKELESIKEKNRKMILENHTYVHRVKQMLEL